MKLTSVERNGRSQLIPGVRRTYPGASVIRRTIGVLAFAVVGLGCRMPSGLNFSEIDIDSPKARALYKVAAASPLRAGGLSTPPSSGSVSIGVPKWWARSQWDRRTSFAVLWKTPARQAEWDFLEKTSGPELVCWTEWQHSPFLVRSPAVANGEQFYEQLRITSGTGGACGDHSGFVVEHWGSHGIRAVDVDDIPQIVAEWEARKRS
jgi:hypothetical protein